MMIEGELSLHFDDLHVPIFSEGPAMNSCRIEVEKAFVLGQFLGRQRVRMLGQIGWCGADDILHHAETRHGFGLRRLIRDAKGDIHIFREKIDVTIWSDQR